MKGQTYSLVTVTVPPPGTVAEPRLLLSDQSYNFWQPHYSPDGRWIAFVAQPLDGAASRVAIMPAAGGAWTPITGIGADKPRWASDGRTIYFQAPAPEGINVWRLAFDTTRGSVIGKPVQMTRFDALRQSISEDAQRDEYSVGRNSLVLPIHEKTGSIWMLDNVDK